MLPVTSIRGFQPVSLQAVSAFGSSVPVKKTGNYYEKRRPSSICTTAVALSQLSARQAPIEREEHKEWRVVSTPTGQGSKVYCSDLSSSSLSNAEQRKIDYQKKNHLKSECMRLTQLVSEGKEYSKAIQALIEAFSFEEGEEEEPVFILLISLLNNKNAYQLLIQTLQQELMSQESSGEKWAFNLITALISFGTLDETLARLLKETALHGEPWKKIEALECIGNFVTSGQGFKMARGVAIQLLKKNPTSRVEAECFRAACKIFTCLVRQKQAYCQAAIAAEKAVSYSGKHLYCYDKGYILLLTLAQKDPKNERLFHVLKKTIANSHSRVQYRSFDPFVALIDRGERHEEALYFAEKWINEPRRVNINYGIELLNALVKNGKGYELAIRTLDKELENPELCICLYLCRIAKNLVEKKQGYCQALKLAMKVIYGHIKNVSSWNAQELLTELVKKGQGIEEASQFLQKERPTTSFELLEAVVEKGSLLKASLSLATSLLQEGDQYKRHRGVRLFRSLFKNNFGFKEAVEILREGLAKSIDALSLELFELSEALVWEEHITKEVTQLAIRGFYHKGKQHRKKALSLFRILFSKNQGIEDALQLVKNGQKIDQSHLKSLAKLSKSLVERELGYSPALLVAKRCLSSSDSGVYRVGVSLLRDLVEKGQGCKPAIEILEKRLKGTVESNIDSLFELSDALVRNGRGYTQARFLVKRGLTSMMPEAQILATALLASLAEQEQCYKQAIAVLEKATETRYLYNHESLLALSDALIEKGQAFPLALSIAMKVIQSEASSPSLNAVELLTKLLEKGQSVDAITAFWKKMDPKKTIWEYHALRDAINRYEREHIPAPEVISARVESPDPFRSETCTIS